MKPSGTAKTRFLLPAALAVVAAVAFALWLRHGTGQPLAMRVPGTDRGPDSAQSGQANPVLAGKLILPFLGEVCLPL